MDKHRRMQIAAHNESLHVGQKKKIPISRFVGLGLTVILCLSFFCTDVIMFPLLFYEGAHPRHHFPRFHKARQQISFEFLM